mmetsp:Transcript_3282/g.5452  ORF Transcript_3282/g.5452 Transcript_3282/m.5452 type:complete len:132 (+) Transcript_3282:474-869(+)
MAFEKGLICKLNSISTVQSLVMKPLPTDIGFLSCTIMRNEKGMNRLAPKYDLKLASEKSLLLVAEKLLKSTTKHYKIKIAQEEPKYQRKDESLYIGRLRSNLTATNFFLYDNGLNVKDQKQKIEQGSPARI